MTVTKIGVDIDGVIADFSVNMAGLLQKYYGINCLTSEFGKFGQQIDELLDTKPEECYNDLTAYGGASKTIDKWRLNDKKVFLITKRGSPKTGPTELMDRVRASTVSWLYSKNIRYDGLFFANDKTIPIDMNGVQLFIEDNLKNSEKIVKSCPVLLVNRTWNQKCDLQDGIIRVEGWEEIDWYVSNLDKGIKL